MWNTAVVSTALLLTLIWVEKAEANAPIPTIIDTDVGQDFDDTFALVYALSLPKVFDVRMVLTASHNTTGRAVLTAKLLDVLGKKSIDVGAGIADRRDPHLDNGVGPQMEWARNYSLHTYPHYYADGVSRAVELLSTASRANPWLVVAIGPLTNVAAILGAHPTLKERIRFATMSGSIHRGYGVNSHTPQAEFNIVQDVAAAQTVFNSTLAWAGRESPCAAPLDTSFFFQIYGDNYKELLTARNRSLLVRTLLSNYQVWYDRGGGHNGGYRPFSPTTATSIMFDLQAMYMANVMVRTPPSPLSQCADAEVGMHVSRLPLLVNGTGFTVIDPSGAAVKVAEALSWEKGDHEGTYALGSHVVSVLLHKI